MSPEAELYESSVAGMLPGNLAAGMFERGDGFLYHEIARHIQNGKGLRGACTIPGQQGEPLGRNKSPLLWAIALTMNPLHAAIRGLAASSRRVPWPPVDEPNKEQLQWLHPLGI